MTAEASGKDRDSTLAMVRRLKGAVARLDDLTADSEDPDRSVVLAKLARMNSDLDAMLRLYHQRTPS